MKSIGALASLTIVLLGIGLPTGPALTALGDEIKLTADDDAGDDSFGNSVAISGNFALVGAPEADNFIDFQDVVSGSAYLFNATTGDQLFELIADDADEFDDFGDSVAISGTKALIGAPANDDAGNASGSAYVFDATTGNQLWKLTASDASANDFFGSSVAISENIALVGAWGDDDAGDFSGSAYLFDATTGDELFKLTADDAAAGDAFGRFSVAISGNIAVVGVPSDDDAGNSSGSAYLFDVTTGDQLLKLTADDAAESDSFGRSVAISGNIVVVGAPGDDDGGEESGSTYLFDATTGDQLFKLTTSDSAEADTFATMAVAISGNRVVVGVYGDDGIGGFDYGAAYLFDAATGNELMKLTASDGSVSDRFGWSVAVSGKRVLVGTLRNASPGSAYLYLVPEPGSAALLVFAFGGCWFMARRPAASNIVR